VGSEECDDGNEEDGDGCSNGVVDVNWVCDSSEPSNCSVAQGCGDGNDDPGEDCDDGNLDPGDGCNANCDVENNWVCDDAEPSTCLVDDDGDGIANIDDNCPDVANTAQLDDDDDGVGNACEPDADGDAVPDESDNCPDVANPRQADLDEDGLGDECDDDADGDGIPNDQDSNPLVPDLGSPTPDPTGCDCGQSSIPTSLPAALLALLGLALMRRRRRV
ncbi:MAG: thrombospondin type 3 repeat-containing protein, partial [Myxococcales bacterium]|nr:thrombospondin type 3 repeat-containing protein [Myxococcales bacterium]